MPETTRRRQDGTFTPGVSERTTAVSAAGKQRVRGRPFRPGRSGNPAGRRPGSLNRSTLQRFIEENGNVTPLAFLLSIMNDKRHRLRTRIECARALLPFLHPRLQRTEVFMPEPDEPIGDFN